MNNQIEPDVTNLTNDEYVALMLIRCGHIDIKGYHLADKWSKLIPRFIWVTWNYLLATFNVEYKKSSVMLLEAAHYD